MSLFDFSYAFPNSVEEIDDFSGKDFEVFLFNFFKVLGYEPRMTDDTNDKGIDLTIHCPTETGHKNVGIQAKRWKGPVGSEEIRTMLDGKKHYNLDEAWIITTSKLTSSATTTAMNNSIEILNREDVIAFIQELHKKPDVKFRPKKIDATKPNYNQIEEKPINYVLESKVELDDSNRLVIELKQLRVEIAKEQRISALYLVFSNNSIREIVKNLPVTIEALREISGFGDKKISLFGPKIVEVVKKYVNSEVSFDRIEYIRGIRSRIAKYNHFETEGDAFSDSVLREIAILNPKNVDDLKKITGFKTENITLFGEYLIRKLDEKNRES